MNDKNYFVSLATLGPIGYLPASGTIATVATLPLVYLLSSWELSSTVHVLIVITVGLVSTKVVGRALEQFKVRDPSEIVLDELVGCLVTFCCLPISFSSLFVGFIAFRFFDIIKPFGVSKCELLYGSFGVVMDDVFAGILAHIVVQFFLYYW